MDGTERLIQLHEESRLSHYNFHSANLPYLVEIVNGENFDWENGAKTVVEVCITKIILDKPKTGPHLSKGDELSSANMAIDQYEERSHEIPQQLRDYQKVVEAIGDKSINKDDLVSRKEQELIGDDLYNSIHILGLLIIIRSNNLTLDETYNYAITQPFQEENHEVYGKARNYLRENAESFNIDLGTDEVK